MDMVGLHALEQHARTLNGSGPLVLENVSPHIRRLFEVVGADHAANLEIRG
jgi:anti-anti-sigma regulatory factor